MADQWDEVRVRRWLNLAEGLDRQLAPVTDALFAAASLQPGERVLDVGCGHGPTTRRAASEVGADGSVTGVDVAEPMLGAASTIEPPAGSAPIEWLHADVGDWDPAGAERTGHEAVISRFGVMFFTDPVRAFSNLAAATAVGGRLAIATWAPRDRSPLFEVPLAVTVPILEARGVDFAVPPLDEGAFSLGTPERMAEVLGAAGWLDVRTVEHREDLAVYGGVGPAEAARAGLDFGPTRVVMTDQPEELRAEVATAIAHTYEQHLDGAGHVRLAGTFLVATATVPAPN